MYSDDDFYRVSICIIECFLNLTIFNLSGNVIRCLAMPCIFCIHNLVE